MMLVSREVYDVIGTDLQREYDALPDEYMGYKRMITAEGSGRIGVICTEDLAYDPSFETEHAKMVLDEVGLTADVANSGQEALKKLEIAHGAFKPYNIVLMDWIMPGMNGKEIAKEIRRIYKNETMVVALTASSWSEIEEEAHSVGVERYLMKPLFAESILSDLESIVQRSGMNIFVDRKRAKLSGRRVLVADDVSINAEILMDTLEIENVKSDYAWFCYFFRMVPSFYKSFSERLDHRKFPFNMG